MAGYSKVQRNDKGFDFFDPRGKKINVDQYVQATGSNKNRLITDLANAGDRVSQSFMRLPEQKRKSLFDQDAELYRQKKNSELNFANFVGEVSKNTADLSRTLASGIQQGAGVVGDVATQGGALIGRFGVQTNPFINDLQRQKKLQDYDRRLVNDNSVTNQIRNAIQSQTDLTGNRIVGTSDVDENASRIANGRGDFRDYSAVFGKGLDAATTATMFATPTALAKGAIGSTARQALNFAGKDALAYAGMDGTAGFANTYGQTGDFVESLKQGLTSAAISGVTQGTLDGIGMALRKTPQATRGAVQAVNDARPSQIAKSDPRVLGFDDQYAQLAQQFDSLPPNSPQRAAVSQAMARNRQERLGMLRSVQREVGQGGYIAGPRALGFGKAQEQGRVFEGVDGVPRFEVDDSGAKFSVPAKKARTSAIPEDIARQKQELRDEMIAVADSGDMDKVLEIRDKLKALDTANPEQFSTNKTFAKDLLDHPKLYDQYPELRNVEVQIKPLSGKNGYATTNESGQPLIVIDSTTIKNDPGYAKGTLLHELQHVIQNKEKFATGSSDPNYDVYRKSAGEAEARAVQARMNMPMSERYVGNTLEDQARKSKSPEAFWNSLKMKTPLWTNPEPRNIGSVKIDDITSSWDMDSRTPYGSSKNNIATLLEKGTSKNKKLSDFAGGKQITKPILVEKNPEGGYRILDGNNRYLQAIANGDKELPVVFKDNSGGVSIDDFHKNATASQPRSTFYDSLDVPKEDLIIRKDGGKAMSIDPNSKEMGQSKASRQEAGQEAQVDTSLDSAQAKSRPLQNSVGRAGVSREALQAQASKSSSTPTINTNRYNISDEAKQTLTDTVEGLSKEITGRTGKKLSLDEVAQAADETTNILKTGKTREATVKATAAMQNARQQQAVLAEKMARGESLTPEEQADMVRLTVSINTTKADLARQLGSLRNTVSARERNIIDVVLDKLSREIGDAEAVAKAAQNYDLSDMRQLGQFYRSFVKATPEDWLDKLRYNSMLSSPVTHSRNIFANVTGSTIVAPAQKIFEGATDAARALITGKQRTRYAGEAGHYAGEYIKGMFSKQAREQFKKAMKGELGDVNVDMNELYSLPLADKGFAGAMDKILGFTTRLTDAVDQWALVAVRKGEEAGLSYRKAKGVDVGDIPSQALKNSEYRLFRQKLGNKEQGYVLRALDYIPQKVLEATASRNPVIRIPAKLTFPFVKTPTNVAKQMIEFSPLGLVTAAGSADKTASIAKAVMGTTAIATLTGTLAANDSLTFGLPTDPKEREKFLAEGKQAYSFKVGDKWLSYQYLHPAISFNMAAVSAVNEALKNGDMDESTANKVLEGMAGSLRFFVDQSYFKSAQDFLNNMTADSFSSPATMAATYANNVVSQFIPFRALMTWVKNMVDPTQRKVDTSQDVFNQFGQNFAKNLPWLSQNLDPYTDALGNPVKNTDVAINAISPVRVKTEKPSAAQGETELDKEINRLYQQDQGIKLSQVSPKTEFNGEKVSLPSEQRKQLSDNINTTTKQLWEKITSDARYKLLDDEGKRKVLGDAKSDVTAAMKDRFAQDYSYGKYSPYYSGKDSKLSGKQKSISDGKLSADSYLETQAQKLAAKAEKESEEETKTKTTTKKKSTRKKSGGGGRRRSGFTQADIEQLASLNRLKTNTASNLLDLLQSTNVKPKASTPTAQKVTLKKIQGV